MHCSRFYVVDAIGLLSGIFLPKMFPPPHILPDLLHFSLALSSQGYRPYPWCKGLCFYWPPKHMTLYLTVIFILILLAKC